jgi:uncharacterized membrane protein
VPASHPNLSDILLAMLEPERIPWDLRLVLLWLVVTPIFIFVPPLSETALRIAVALPLVLFLPGYALLAALFPRRTDLGLGERAALSVGLSVALVPLIGLVLNYTSWGIRLVPVAISLEILTLALGLVAHGRRLALPAADRFSVRLADFTGTVSAHLFPEGSSRMDRALSWILLFSVVLALGTTLFVIATPRVGERFTEFYILDLNGKAADYPTKLAAGVPAGVVVGIGNQEYRPVDYTVEVLLANRTWDPVSNVSVLERMMRVDAFSVSLAHNQTWERRVNFTVPDPSWNRIDFLLFNESVPGPGVTGTDRINASYRNLHLWFKVGS